MKLYKGHKVKNSEINRRHKRYSPEQIIQALINGISCNCRVSPFCKNAGIPLSTFFRWRKKCIEAEFISFQRNHAPNRSSQKLLFEKERLCNQLELQIELQKVVNKNTSKLNTSKKLELITIVETNTLPKSKSLK